MSGNGSQQVPLVPNQQPRAYSGGYPTATTPHREPYPHQGAPGFQQNCGTLSLSAAPKPQAPQQQDMSKNPTMTGIYLAGHGAQHRQQMNSYQYQTQQTHAPRAQHQRPAFIHSNQIANSAPMMFGHMMSGQMQVYPTQNATVMPAASYTHRPTNTYYPNTAMGVLSSQNYQPYPYHPSYYYSTTPVAPAGAASVRGQGAAALGPPAGGSGAVSLPPAPVPVQAMSTHIPPIPGTLTQPTPLQTNFGPSTKTNTRRKYALAIVDPITGLDVSPNLNSGDSSERQTPQPEPVSSSAAEEMKRLVAKAAERDTSPAAPTNSNNESAQIVAKSRQNSISNKFDQTHCESNPKTENDPEPYEPPVVSALSDSPEIVPKQIPSAPIPAPVVEQNKPREFSTSNNQEDAKDIKQIQDGLESKEHIPIRKPLTISNVPPKKESTENSTHSDYFPKGETEHVKPEPINEEKTHTITSPNLNNNSNIINEVPVYNKTNTIPKIESLMDENLNTLVNDIADDYKKLSIEKQADIKRSNDATEALKIPELPEVAIDKHEKPIQITIEEEIQTETAPIELNTTVVAQVKANQKPSIAIGKDTEDEMNDIEISDNLSNSTVSNLKDEAKEVETINEINKPVKDSTVKKVSILIDNTKGTDEIDRAVVEDATLTVKSETYTRTVVNVVPDVPKITPERKVTLTFPYRDDQWSPINTTGKKNYDRDLLMMLSDSPKSKERPENMENMRALMEPIGAVNDRIHNIYATLSRQNEGNTFLPGFAKSPSQRGTPMRDNKKGASMNRPGSRTGNSGMMNKSNVIHVSLSLGNDVKLNETENAWKPSRLAEANLPEGEVKTQELYKTVRSVLNKLTPEKFATLVDKVRALSINTQAHLEGVIDLVFKKAIDEPNFSVAYALMCKELSTIEVPSSTPNPSGAVPSANFRILLLNRCRDEFARMEAEENKIMKAQKLMECDNPDKRKELLSQLEEDDRKIRMKSVGNIRFIGELYKNGMLRFTIMTHCINKLLEKEDEQKLECLCKLLTTIGSKLEVEINPKKDFDKYFKTMHDIVSKKKNKISSRVRFMLQDVMELRRRNWILRHNEINPNPKTMGQIQKEAEMEQINIQIMNSGHMTPRKEENMRGSKRGGGRSASTNSPYDDRPAPPRNNYPLDHKKLQSLNTTSTANMDEIKLGPPTHHIGWIQGSSAKGSTKRVTTNMTSLLTTTNMYSALSDLNTDSMSVSNKGAKDTSSPYQSKGTSMERSSFKDTASSLPTKSGSVGESRLNEVPHASKPVIEESKYTGQPSTLPAGESSKPKSSNQPEKSANQIVTAALDELLNVTHNMNDITEDLQSKYTYVDHSEVVIEIVNYCLEKSPKYHQELADLLVYLVVTSKVISKQHFALGLGTLLNLAPDYIIDIPKVYQYLSTLIAPHIIHKSLTLADLLSASDLIIKEKQGELFLRCIISQLLESVGVSLVTAQWQQAGLHLSQWMDADQIPRFIKDNKFEFLVGEQSKQSDVPTAKVKLHPDEVERKLLNFMESNYSTDVIDGWIKDKVGEASRESWFIRALTQALCQQALTGGSRGLRLDIERMGKYAQMLTKYGEGIKEWELQCLFGIQKLLHRLEHPQGITLELFQYLFHEYIIPNEGFQAWEKSNVELEGKGVMLKALVSFFTGLKESDSGED